MTEHEREELDWKVCKGVFVGLILFVGWGSMVSENQEIGIETAEEAKEFEIMTWQQDSRAHLDNFTTAPSSKERLRKERDTLKERCSDLELLVDKFESEAEEYKLQNSDQQNTIHALQECLRLKELECVELAKDKETNVEWDGEGLPPVGVECEILTPVDVLNPGGNKSWYKTKILSVHDAGFGEENIVTYTCNWSPNFYVDAHPAESLEFRKPLTPEQKAEDEANSEVVEMLQCFCDCYGKPDKEAVDYVRSFLAECGYVRG